LVEILQMNGKNVFTGHNGPERQKNYDAVVKYNLLPPNPKIITREEVANLSDRELGEYLYRENMRGRNGGLALKEDGKPRPRAELMQMYNRYASMVGYGLADDIKSRFEIIDGEIQSGNNNPQLIRDARKLLKEMVTKKLITLYEAQTHLKHLRKLNKI